jgi:hypothetical protein
VARQERLDLGAQRRVLVAGAIEQRSTVLRRAGQRFVEDRLHALPALGVSH